MPKPLPYSTKYIDKELERIRERKQKGICEELQLVQMRLDERIREGRYDWIINSLCSFRSVYSSEGDYCFQVLHDIQKAKENYYLAASVSRLCYIMVKKGLPHHFMDSGSPYDFKKKNFNFSKDAILANETELALQIAGKDTIEGALLLQDYERACRLLPASPEEEAICKDEIRQCMWVIAHGEEKTFNKYMKKRVGILRRQARIMATVIDGWGLALVKLAKQRGISCDLNVIELPQHLLDDARIDTSGLVLPMEEQIHDVLRKWNPR